MLTFGLTDTVGLLMIIGIILATTFLICEDKKKSMTMLGNSLIDTYIPICKRFLLIHVFCSLLL